MKNRTPEGEAKRLQAWKEWKATAAPKSEETRRKLSAALSAKWASGTRKLPPPEMYESVAIKNKLHAAAGRICNFTSEDRLKYSRMGGRINGQNPNTKAQIRAIGLAHKGQPNPPGRAAKGPDHWKAKWWHFRSPAGFTIEGFNLSHLIRENSHLFDPCDVVWKDFSCNASKRLAQLMSDDGKLCSWHGWVAVGSRERADMLSRKLDPPK